MSFNIDATDISYIRTKSGREYYAIDPKDGEKIDDYSRPFIDAWEVAVYTGLHGNSSILDVENKGRGIAMWTRTDKDTIHSVFIPFDEVEVVGT